MDDLVVFVDPYILWAIAVGGVVYPWRFFKSNRRRFFELYACIVLGVTVGFVLDRSVDGLRSGMVIGAIAMPALMRARREQAPFVRNEADSEHEGAGGTNERAEHVEAPEEGDAG